MKEERYFIMCVYVYVYVCVCVFSYFKVVKEAKIRKKFRILERNS